MSTKEKKSFFRNSVRIKHTDACNDESTGLDLRKPIGDKDDRRVDEPTGAISKKKREYMKGASQLDATEKKFYDIKVVLDPSARASKKMGRAGSNAPSPSGDGDVWIEKIFRHRETGDTKIFFVSKNTGTKVKLEPPTGASNVMYLRDSYKSQNSSPPSTPSGKDRKKSSRPNSPDKRDETNAARPNSPENNRAGSPGNTSGSDDNSNYTERWKQRSCVPCKILKDQTIPSDRPL